MRRFLPELTSLILLLPVLILFAPAGGNGGERVSAEYGLTMGWRLGASLGVACCAGIAAMVLSFPLLPIWARGQRRLQPWMGMPLVVMATPPFLIASGLIALPARLSTLGGGRLVIPPMGIASTLDGGVTDLFFGPVGCVVSYGLSYWPIPFLTAGLLRRPMRHGAESAAMMLVSNGFFSRSAWRLYWKLDWPRLWPGYCAGGVLTAMLSLSDFMIPELHQVQTLMLDIALRLNGHFDVNGAAKLALPIMVCIAGLAILLAWLIQRSASWRFSSLGEDIPHPSRDAERTNSIHSNAGMTTVPFVLLTLLTGISLGLPFLGLVMGIRSYHLFSNGVRLHAPYFLNSLVYCFVTAGVLILIAAKLGMNWAESRKPPGRMARMLTITALFLFLIPAPLLGIGLAQLVTSISMNLQALGLPLDLRLSKLVVITAFVWRWLIVAFLLGWMLRTRLHPMVQRALTCGMVAPRIRSRLAWPMSALPLSMAFSVVLVLVSGEAVISNFVKPPGGDTLAAVFYDLLHYGQDEQTASAGLLLLLVPLLVLAFMKQIFRRMMEWDE